MRRRQGFTLIEVLVVLVILGVLAAILWPVLSRARAMARKAVCVTQISQLYQAVKMYSDDYDRTIVPARTKAPHTGTLGITWCILLQPYIKCEEILICPDDPSPQPSKNSTCLPHSYGINYLLAYNSIWGPYPLVTSISHVKRPSETILFFEMKDGVGQMGASYYAHRLSRIGFRHFDVGNFAFLDGHVKGLRADVLKNRRYWDPFAG